jgi:hypothetical protein
MLRSEAKVCSFAEAWQLVQYWPKPMSGSAFFASAGQSGFQVLRFVRAAPQSSQPQNQPS